MRAAGAAIILCALVARSDRPTMSETPPDRLAVDPSSRFHDQAALDRGVGVRFNGVERDNVEEYSVSEGWIRVQVGKSLDRRGQPMTLKIKGKVEPYFKTEAA
jgi:hypothetical protein